MYLKILACDLDGTLAENGVVSDESWQALRLAKKAGFILILVTGRTLSTFTSDGPFVEMFEAIVAENGAAVYYTRNDSVVLPFGRVDEDVTRRLRSSGIPLEEGMAILATWMPHVSVVDDVLHSTGRGATVEYNKGAVMILPPGATKGTGLNFALTELGYSPHNVIALGDAENDRSLFEVAEVAIAVANAVPEIQDLADHVLSLPNGAGVSDLVKQLNSGDCVPETRREGRMLGLGNRLDGTAVTIDPVRLLCNNLAIVGGSSSGKSWLAGLIAEELLERHYQICIIDPEGDYSGLRAFPHTVVVGGRETGTTPVEDVVTLCEYSGVSPILDLSLMEVGDRQRYIGDLLRSLQALRERRGRPHWILIDEIHNFCPADGSGLTSQVIADASNGGLCIVSYRPSLVAPALFEKIDQWLLTRMRWAPEIEHLSGYVTGCPGLDLNRLRSMPIGDAVLCQRESANVQSRTEAIRFRMAKRSVPHVRHLHKYLRAPLPPSSRFYFDPVEADGSRPIAASLWEFVEALHETSRETIRYHLEREDFERWLRNIVHDDELARRLRKIRNRKLSNEHLREAVVQTVSERFEELESLI